MIVELLMVQIAFFLVLMLAMRKLFHGHLLKAIGRVNKLQEKTAEKEERLKSFEQRLREERDKQLKELEGQIRDRRHQAEEEIKAHMNRLKFETEKEKEMMIQIFKDKEKKLERRFDMEAKRQGGSIAAELIKESFSEKMLKLLHHEMADELIESIGKSKTKAEGAQVKVRTAFPLSEGQKNHLKQKVKAQKIEEVVDAKLIAGFELSLGKLVLDGSLRNRFEKELMTGAKS